MVGGGEGGMFVMFVYSEELLLYVDILQSLYECFDWMFESLNGLLVRQG
jgi:hypothetical protein